ncbi:MAG: DNA replication and repair protein RecF [Verrucomicrobia subdivision 3 bacterium]|nr:DNA replication and repair protein RecF [Limisphaerales bacterium]MCS1414931.1 DNA replication and repair protein RecF [Limisphaerales bacterium]
MHLAHLRLRDFRNYRFLDIDFEPGFQLILGDNAQGKTNILESIYLLATLRSFRGVGGAQMIRYGERGYFVGSHVIGDSTRDLALYWSVAERQITIDGEPIKALSDFLGALRAVVFCTEDLQLVKGTARIRRRFVDLLLSQTESAYLPLLERYTRTLRSRNALLKRAESDPGVIESFSQELVRTGNDIIRRRERLLPKISALARLAYRRIANDAEEFRFVYQPHVKQDFAMELARSQPRELRYRATVVGPHRDDIAMMLDDRNAVQFGSEGQKRSIAVSLKMAQAEFLTGIIGVPPVLLIDDIMGELDMKRRTGLLPLLERLHQTRGQVFMTCTDENWPRELGRRLHRWQVTDGTVRGVNM